MDDHTRAILGLACIPTFGPIRLRRLLSIAGTPEQLWTATASTFREWNVSDDLAAAFLRQRATVDLDAVERATERCDARLIPYDADAYPPHLRNLPDAPIGLFVRGTTEFSPLTVSVVGTRQPTPYGRQCTATIVEALARAGVQIVSGLAYGIDAAAHMATLAGSGVTVAVLASGVDIIAPAVHTSLAHEILRNRGALVSEFPPGTQPQRHHFPIRNRILAGMSPAVLIVEAPVRSGALLTAQLALEYNRDVFAVPGPITSPTSVGTNRLIRDGAQLLESADGMLRFLNLETASTPTRPPETSLTTTERLLLQHVTHEPRSVDLLITMSTLDASIVNTALVLLEMKGWVTQIDPLHYVRKR